MQLLDAETLAVVKESIKDVVDTFFKLPVKININAKTAGRYGEGAVHNAGSPVQRDFLAMASYGVGMDGRYVTVHFSDMGNRLEDGWRIFLWKDAVDASGIVVNPEKDTITILGKEYAMKMWAPSALFSDLGFFFYECEIKAKVTQ